MIFIALLLLVEGFSTGFWIFQIVPSLRHLGWAVVVLALLRALVGLMQWVGGMSLLMRRRNVIAFCQIALIASAVLTTFEIGARITPNNLDPTWRWPLVAAYWIYAVGAAAWLQVRQVRGPRGTEAKNTVPEVTLPDLYRRRHDGDSDDREGPGSVD